MKDDGFFDAIGWQGVSDKSRRDPLGAIYDLKNVMAEVEGDIEKRQIELARHQDMLEYLRGIARSLMGESVETESTK